MSKGKLDCYKDIKKLFNLRNMDSMINILGISGIKVVDTEMMKFTHELVVNILSTVQKNISFLDDFIS